VAFRVVAGQAVKKGDTLAVLSTPELTAALEEAKAAAASARADRTNVLAGVRKEEVEIAAENVRIAEANLVLAQQQHTRAAALAARLEIFVFSAMRSSRDRLVNHAIDPALLIPEHPLLPLRRHHRLKLRAHRRRKALDDLLWRHFHRRHCTALERIETIQQIHRQAARHAIRATLAR